VLLLVGAATGRDGIQGASFASATLGDDREERRPAVQVGNPFLEKLLMEACLELAALEGVVAMQDLGAAGLTCALAELTARGGVGAEVDLDRVPRRETGMSPYEVLLSESQERMLVVVRPDAVDGVRAVFARYELTAAAIGEITDGTLIRCRAAGEVVCEVAGRSLADDAPRYVISGVARDPQPLDFGPLAAEAASASVLLELLASPNVRDRKPIWRRYDHMNGTNTLVGPGRGDAALLRLKGTHGALALAIDGPGPARLGALDPYLAGASAVLEGALNVACSGATPIGITDCLNFGSPETDLGAWQLERAIDGIADACRLLDLPVVSGNVSLYNETPDGPILPTPVVGTVGLLEDRSAAVPMAWHDADELWLIGDPGDDPDALAASELAWGRGMRGGRPSLDLDSAGRVVHVLPRLAGERLITGAHDVSVGGLAVALARVAISAGCGASVELDTSRPTAALFGERAGRVIVGCRLGDGERLRDALDAAEVPGRRIGVAGGQQLEIATAGQTMTIPLDELSEAWRRPF
jgi:phosphoribosylformylglycinamidine synthase